MPLPVFWMRAIHFNKDAGKFLDSPVFGIIVKNPRELEDEEIIMHILMYLRIICRLRK